MSWLMAALHLPTMDHHISEMPDVISDKALWFWETFKGIVDNSLFNVYDPTLKRSVKVLRQEWERALSYPSQYRNSPNGIAHHFWTPMDMQLLPQRERVWDEIKAARDKMRVALDEILDRLRSSYLEIDIHETNKQAWQAYRTFNDEMNRMWGDVTPHGKRMRRAKPTK